VVAYHVMNVERALITTVESERNIIAVRKAVASRESATICRQITFSYVIPGYTPCALALALAHAYAVIAATRPGSAGCRNCTTGGDAVPSARHKAAPGNGKPVEGYLAALQSPVIAPVYRNTGKSVLVPFFLFFLSSLSLSLSPFFSSARKLNIFRA